MSKVLIVYGSNYGQTGRIVEGIACILKEQGHRVSLWKGDRLPEGLDLRSYDAFLVAASVIGGKHQGYIRDFVSRHASVLNARPSAFVSVSGTAATEPQVARKLAARFLRSLDWRPDSLEVFGGAIAYTRYNPIVRLIMKMISWRKGGSTDTSRDHELTDWAQVEQFAFRFSGALGVFSRIAARSGRPITAYSVY